VDINDNAALTKLKTHLPELTKTQQRVAEFLIREPAKAIFLTVEQIANKSHTSPATVIRMANELGYTGFSELQEELQAAMRDQLLPASRLPINKNSSQSKDELTRTIVDTQLQNITDFVQNVPTSLIYQAVECIEQAVLTGHKLYICGNRSSFAAANYLSYNFNRMFGNVRLVSSEIHGYIDQLNEFEVGDVLVAISFIRYSRNTLDTENWAARQGLKVIAVTDSPISPMAEHADILFVMSCNSLHFHNSIMSTMMLNEELIGLLAERNPEIVKKNLERQESITKANSIHVL